MNRFTAFALVLLAAVAAAGGAIKGQYLIAVIAAFVCGVGVAMAEETYEERT